MDDVILREFISAARWGSFSKAAKECHVSQPAFSKHMASLEKHLGVELFSRESGEAQITPIGRVFLRHAKQIVLNYDAAFDQIEQLKKEKPLRLSVELNDSYYPAVCIVQDLESDLVQRYPLLSIDVHTVENASPLDDVRDGNVDMCFAVTEKGLETPGLQALRLYNEPVVALVEKSHRLAEQRAIDPSLLEDETIWLVQHPAYTHYTNAIRQLVLEHVNNPVFKYGTWESVQGSRWDFTSGVLVALSSVLLHNTPRPVRKNYSPLAFSNGDMCLEVNAFYRREPNNRACALAVDYLDNYFKSNSLSSIWEESPTGWHNSER